MTDEMPESAPETPVVDFAQQFATVVAERDALKDKWTRSVAELENVRRRLLREMDEERRFAAMPLLKAILPGIDNLARAIQAAEVSGPNQSLLDGVKMVLSQMDTAMAPLGVKPINSTGQAFDPHLHEAITQQPSAEHPAMTVLMEVERGYQLHERVVRPSKVIVSIAPPAAE